MRVAGRCSAGAIGSPNRRRLLTDSRVARVSERARVASAGAATGSLFRTSCSALFGSFHTSSGTGSVRTRPQTTREQIDGLSARLRLESWWDGDHILEELIEIYRAVEAWKEHAEHGGEIQNLMDPLRQQVLRSLQSLEDEIRKNLGVPTPVLIPPRRRT